MAPSPDGPDGPDVLIVGAGPTGLALAAQLDRFGASFRVVDRSLDRAHESRALGVQARTLELLDAVGVADRLVARGRTSTRLALHLEARTVAEVRLGDIGAADTRFPFILFVSQAETERLLAERLSASGVAIERGVELVAFEAGEAGVECVLLDRDGREERVRARFLVGCDGAHSAVRRGAGFSFEGGSYPQRFLLGDVEADGSLEPDAINSFGGAGGAAMFFPLGHPATWRVIAMEGREREEATPATPAMPAPAAGAPDELSLVELQAAVDPPTGRSVRLRDPVWLTRFRLHHRQTSRYRMGRVFLAGDAAHIHSPVGAQGMNTGIQDAWNLGWKLALVARGAAREALLDSYDAERWPVGHRLLRYTDRAFGTFARVMSRGRVATWARSVVVSRVLPHLVTAGRLRSVAFRFVSQLGIRYRRSPAVSEGAPPLAAGPRAGDRMPDARVALDGRPASLQRATTGAHLTLLLCGDGEAWDASELSELTRRYGGLLVVLRLTRRTAVGALVDESGDTLRTLGVGEAAQYLVRPDGHVAFRCAGRDLGALRQHLARWYVERDVESERATGQARG